MDTRRTVNWKDYVQEISDEGQGLLALTIVSPGWW
jgi:hypothetical protein